MKAIPISLAGAYLLELPKHIDHRGFFIKNFQKSIFEKSGIHFDLKESYFSCSAQNTIRGMHFQNPPHQHSKLVFCSHGKILDVIIDLRQNSPTFKQYFIAELSAEFSNAIYIPEGFGHGFLALTEGAITQYFVSGEYHPDSDAGILYNSFGFDWPIGREAILSERDLNFPTLDSWASPFSFE